MATEKAIRKFRQRLVTTKNPNDIYKKDRVVSINSEPFLPTENMIDEVLPSREPDYVWIVILTKDKQVVDDFPTIKIVHFEKGDDTIVLERSK